MTLNYQHRTVESGKKFNTANISESERAMLCSLSHGIALMPQKYKQLIQLAQRDGSSYDYKCALDALMKEFVCLFEINETKVRDVAKNLLTYKETGPRSAGRSLMWALEERRKIKKISDCDCEE